MRISGVIVLKTHEHDKRGAKNGNIIYYVKERAYVRFVSATRLCVSKM